MANRYLLDTHAFLWATYSAGASKLSISARKAIEEAESELYVSSVSLYEISNKHRKGKLPVYKSVAERLLEALHGLEAIELPLGWEQASLAGKLDWVHKDPFDRLLAAQAQSEGLTLITCDAVFGDAPGVEILW